MTEVNNMTPEMRFLSDTTWPEIHRALQAAFADYAIDMGYMTVDYLGKRSHKNGVDLSVSPGIFVDGKLVGFTLVGLGPWKGTQAAFDSATGLVKEWRGKGYASAMFDFALPALKERGVKKFVLEVLQENKPAIRAYEKSGFKIVRELECFDIHPQSVPEKYPAPRGIILEPAEVDILNEFEKNAAWPLSWECSFAAQRRAGHDMMFLTAKAKEEVVGLAAFHTRLNWLMALLVKPGWRQQGIATALVRHILSEYGRTDDRIRCDNIQKNDLATQTLLQKLGFDKMASQFEMDYMI